MNEIWRKGTRRGGFDWRTAGGSRHPPIWAYKTDSGWECQFAHREYGLTATGRTRAEATNKLMGLFDQKSYTT